MLTRRSDVPSRADRARGLDVVPRGVPSVAPSSGGRRRPPALLTLSLVAALTAVGAALRFAGIGDKSLWIDEAFSVWTSRQPLEGLWRTTVQLDAHPPLYYVLLHVWLALGGDDEAAVRSLSALLGVLTLPVVFLIGVRIGGRALGLLSTGLFAFSPLHVAFAQQARMYTMLTFFAALSILSLLLVLGEPDRSGPRPAQVSGRTSGRRAGLRWALFVLSTTATLLSHNAAVLEPFTIALFVAVVLIRSARRVARGHAEHALPVGSLRRPLSGVVGVATGLCAAVVLWLPWLPSFLSQWRRVDAEFWIPPPTVSTVLQHWHVLTSDRTFDGAAEAVVVLGGSVLVALGAWRLRAQPDVLLLLLLLVLAPVAVELLVSLRRPVFYSQTLIWTSIPFTVLLAAGILGARRRPLVVLVAGAVLVCNTVGVRSYRQEDGLEDWRAAVDHVAQHVRPGELVLFSAAWAQVPFDYYYERSAGPVVTQHGLPTDVSASRALEAKMTPADLPRLDDLTAGRSTVWLVSSHDWYTDPRDLVPSRLSASFPVVEGRDFPGITVARYEVAPD